MTPPTDQATADAARLLGSWMQGAYADYGAALRRALAEMSRSRASQPSSGPQQSTNDPVFRVFRCERNQMLQVLRDLPELPGHSVVMESPSFEACLRHVNAKMVGGARGSLDSDGGRGS